VREWCDVRVARSILLAPAHTLTVSMMPAEAATLPVCVFHVCTVSKTFAAPLTWMPTRPAKTIVSEM
jgi:hypothetical protein